MHVPAAASTWWGKVHRAVGFSKGYNFILFFILTGTLLGFTLAHLRYLHHPTFLANTNPSDGVYYTRGATKVGIRMHLFGAFLAAMLAVLQFTPVIRHRFRLFHRFNGYVVITLFLVSKAGVYIKIPTSGGSDASTSTALGLLGAVALICLAMAYYNIKRLRIDLHREWMIRMWVYSGAIITLRFVSMGMMRVMLANPEGRWYSVQTCQNIWDQHARLLGVPDADNPTPLKYPACVDAPNTDASTLVHLTDGLPEGIATGVNLTFGLATWLAFALHAIGVEIYFRLTRAESERLKALSHERRVAAGMVGRGKQTPNSDAGSEK
ncbi:hypothetical protein CERZMDRAFT_35463 [Cercospora zeae-maydis SCOH1-5]|uniref:Uncharacterized protein n=1 Tax=Cercospora zeae-maydis SCOH1-5 TaxID=717836 RepID=A0A6A6FPM8_9PEZI|nr:hypothetical protein CERZMDRAFT_35463 [Cercospora zeae-maydis SCOH1-5]